MSVRFEDDFRTPFHQAYLKHVGRGRRFSTDDIVRMVGISRSYADKLLAGTRTPCEKVLFKLFHVLGEAFVRHYMHPQGYSIQRASDEPACPFETIAQATTASATLADAMQDRKLTECELDLVRSNCAALLNKAVSLRPGRFG